MIVHPKEDVHLDRHVPEEIILSCELSRPNGVVNWFKDGQKLQESENIKLKVEGPYRRLKILCSGVEDSGEYVCDTADDSIFFHLSLTGRKLKEVKKYLITYTFQNNCSLNDQPVMLSYLIVSFQSPPLQLCPQASPRWNSANRPLRGWS